MRQDGCHETRATASLERRAARGHLVENHPQRKDVRACIRVAPLDLLRRHIRDGAEHRALLGQFEALRGSLDGLLAFEVPQFCKPEIEKFHAAAGEHDVARLQIAMNHALPVGGVESPGDVAGERDRPIHRNGTALQTFGERLSLEQLHHEKRHAVDFADVVNGADVRVGYPGDRPRFTLKSLQLQGRRMPRRRQDLDRDRPIELRVPSAIDLAHASGADWRQDFVTANSFSRSQGHGCQQS